MTIAVTICDESGPGQPTHSFRLELVSERLTARELIERRVRVEVERVNREKPGMFRTLVQPSEAEVALNGYKLKDGKWLDADAQVEQACAAFGRNGFLLLVGDRQVEELDELIVLEPGSQVTFLKLFPLIGG